MPQFHLSDFILETELAFPELLPCSAACTNQEIISLVSEELKSQFSTLEKFHSWQQFNEETWLNFYQQGEDFFIEYPQVCAFKITKHSAQISYQISGELDLPSWRHLFLDQIVPLWLSQQQKLVLHAASLGTPESGAFVFFGASGAGKSTVALKLLPFLPLIADDFSVCISSPSLQVLPSYPVLRLWKNPQLAELTALDAMGISSKQRFQVAQASFSSLACPLRALIILQRAEHLPKGEFKLVPASAEESFGEILKNLFVLETNSSKKQQCLLENLSDLLSKTQAYNLYFSDLDTSAPKLYQSLMQI